MMSIVKQERMASARKTLGADDGDGGDDGHDDDDDGDDSGIDKDGHFGPWYADVDHQCDESK